MANLFKLTIDDGKGNAETIAFDQDTVVIGRDPSSDLVVDDIEISRTHLVITREEGGFFAEDNNSTNGTTLNGKQLKKKTAVNSGDNFVLGKDHRVLLDIPIAEAALENEKPSQPEGVVEVEPEPVEESTDPAHEPAVEFIETQNESVEAPVVKDEKPKKVKKTKKAVQPARPKWMVILLAVLAFIIIFCVIPFIVIEVTNQWCDLFAGFFNSLSPGVCP